MRFSTLAISLFACWPIGLAGCAPKGPSPQFLAEIAKAEALLGEGCYTCLKESLALFEKHAAAKVPLPGAKEGAFNAALLIAIREGELGIPNEASWTTARAMVLPSRQPLLDAAALIIGDTTALDPEQRAQRTGRSRRPVEPDNPTRRALDAA